MTNGSSDRLDQIETVLLRVATQQEANTLAIAELTANADADRKMIWTAMDQHDVVLARLDRMANENQQILNYLFGQQRSNGYGDQPQQ